jgi:predicted nuclease of restriction endonuclease-like (RecB) superfamily
MSDLTPDGYSEALSLARQTILSARSRALLIVSAELTTMYWDLGRLILDRQATYGWGAKIVVRLAADLQREFPDIKGLSAGNLHYMRRFATVWPDRANLPTAVGKIPWGHNRLLLDRLSDTDERAWYAAATIEYGWSRAVLENQIMSGLHQRAGVAPSNFGRRLPAADSDLVQQMIKDPYALEFVTLARDVSERDLELALVARVELFLRELGRGFSFVGRQYRLDVDGDEFFVDLLMFDAESNRYCVIELKTKKLTPADVGQLNFYVAVVDDTLRRAHHAETVGLLLCASRNDRTVRYALARSTSPLAIAGYRYTELPATDRGALPNEHELLDLVTQVLDDDVVDG